FSADGTARETGWESRSPPKILYKKPDIITRYRAFFIELMRNAPYAVYQKNRESPYWQLSFIIYILFFS
ncbi:MAG: hypothetical protein B6I22_08835, partial [Desulfobacteraceae bacterium 4572_123]